jgi:putative peptide zinc metalloprotease protein
MGSQESSYIPRRADGQVIQLSCFMYLLASNLHDPRDLQRAAALLSEFSRVVSAQQVPYLMENRLRMAGIMAVDSGHPGCGLPRPSPG